MALPDQSVWLRKTLLSQARRAEPSISGFPALPMPSKNEGPVLQYWKEEIVARVHSSQRY